MKPTNVAMRKRTQIAVANKTMFLWVAGVSIVFGASIVAVYFLAQMAFYNEKVLHEKDVTLSNLNSNLANIDKLKKNILKLDTNSDLASIKANPDDKSVQVVLDALPSEANSLAFGASLQNKLLADIKDLTISKLQVNPVVGVESLSIDESTVDASQQSQSQQTGEILFTFSVEGDVEAIKSVLMNLEKSIRAVDIMTLKIESQADPNQTGGKTQLTLSIEGKAFYEPKKEIKLVDKVVKS